MGIFLDSAINEEVKRLTELGLITGVTTNPKLLAQANKPWKETIKELSEISPGPVFYQLTKDTLEEMEKEAKIFHEISPQKIAMKIPAKTENMALIKKIGNKIPCAVTAIFSDYQTYLACEVGAKYLIPYVNRATRLIGDGVYLVSRMREIINATGCRTEILAASVKTAEEAVNCVLAGAHHLSMPFEVIMSLGNHPLSEDAIKEFSKFIKPNRK